MLIVSGRPATNAQTWWILADDPTPLTVTLLGEHAGAEVVVHSLPDVADHGDARAYLVAATGLAPDTEYEILGETMDGDQDLGRGRTLPSALPPNVPFTIALGSCYNWPMDVAEIRTWFPPASHTDDSTDPLRLAFLLGDQIYMDLKKRIDVEKPTSWSEPLPEAPDPWAAYLEQWGDRGYADLLAKMPPCMFLADDHEMWNDFPHTPPWLSWAKGAPAKKLERELRNAFDVFQAALNVDPQLVAGASSITHQLISQNGYTIHFDAPPLSFFMLDTRLGRTRTDTPGAVQFTDPAHLDALAQWLAKPGGLGILVVGPPVFQGKGSGFDHNLADYTADYARLIGELSRARKRVLILAGDIHYTRLYSITRFDPVDARDELRVVELTSSPLSRLKEGPGMGIPSGPEVREGVLGDSGAHFVLEVTDPALGGGDFVTIARQSYCTVSFTHLSDHNVMRVVISAWQAPAGPGPAQLVLQRTLNFPMEEP